MMKTSTVKNIRRFPVVVLGYLVSMIILQASFCFIDRYKIVSLTARTSAKFPEKIYRRVDTKEFTYTTGIEGKVNWKAKTPLEAFSLNFFANEDAMITATDVLYLLMLDVILFWMLHDLKPENIFSEKIFVGSQYLSYLSALLLIKKIFNYYISNYFLKQITQGKFEAIQPSQSQAIMAYFLGFMAFQILLKFFLQAQKSEREQELTI